MSLNLSINEETMRPIIAKAILDGIGDDARTELIQTAINYLVAPTKTDHYSSRRDGPSPLEDAFKQAVNKFAHKVVLEYIENDPEVREIVTVKIADLLGAYKAKLAGDYDMRTELNTWVIDYLSDRKRP